MKKLRSTYRNTNTVCGNDIFALRLESVVPFNSRVQMESNTPQDFVALAMQIQTLTAGMKELTR